MILKHKGDKLTLHARMESKILDQMINETGDFIAGNALGLTSGKNKVP
jgi:hypothetical protein